MENNIPKTRKLNNGLECPSLGLGTAQMANIAEVLYESIKQGARLIDTAAIYGNEKEVGEGIAKAIKENIVTRDEIYIITKLTAFDRSKPEEAIKQSLEKLNLTYVDLYLDHWPLTFHTKNNEVITKTPSHVVWKQMEELVKKGYTKSIGVSNYNVQSMLNLLSYCEIKPAFLEVEYHPYLVQKGLKELCDRQNIRLIAYNSLVKGPYIDQFHKDIKVDLLQEDCVKKCSEKYNKTPGQIALNWALAQGIVVIPKTSNSKRMTENLGALSFKMSDEEVNLISALNKGYRFCGSTNWPEAFDGLDYFA